jgi:invasion protein IalB
MTERLVVGGAALVAGLVLGWMVRGVATYNTATESVTAYQDWHMACPAAKSKEVPCEMAADVVDAQSKSVVARIALTRDKDKQVVVLTLPFGVALEQPVSLKVGSEPAKQFSYRTCNNVGCVAVGQLDGNLEKALRRADDAKLQFAGLDGKQTEMPVSLKGYNAAHSAYKREESKRASWFWRLWS